MNRKEYGDHCNSDEEDAILEQEADEYWYGVEPEDEDED